MLTDILRDVRTAMLRMHDYLAEECNKILKLFYSHMVLRGKIGGFHLNSPDFDADGFVMVREVGEQKITTTIPFRIENRWVVNGPRLSAQAVAEIFTELHLSSYRAVGFHFKGMWYSPGGRPTQVHPPSLYRQSPLLAYE